MISAVVSWPSLPDTVNLSFHPMDRQSGITYPITEGAVINHFFYQFSSQTIIITDVLESDFESRLIMETDPHIPLFPSWLAFESRE